MGIKREIKRLFEKLSGTHIYRTVPRGIDIFEDLKNYLPNLQIRIVFDVGANIGQSCSTYLNRFPGSTIYCFEPVDATFRQLQSNVGSQDNVHSFKLALGATHGTGKMVLEGNTDGFFLMNIRGPERETSPLEEVNLETLDGFCAHQNIAHINYLKIDTEGGDFEVLRGAENMLNLQYVDVVQVEAGMNRSNARHVPFTNFLKFFEEKNYFLFAIYEQVNEFLTQEPHLRRTNPVFISNRVIKANPAPWRYSPRSAAPRLC
jgi:FkbM family methyltransferase